MGKKPSLKVSVDDISVIAHMCHNKINKIARHVDRSSNSWSQLTCNIANMTSTTQDKSRDLYGLLWPVD